MEEVPRHTSRSPCFHAYVKLIGVEAKGMLEPVRERVSARVSPRWAAPSSSHPQRGCLLAERGGLRLPHADHAPSGSAHGPAQKAGRRTDTP